MRQLCLVFCCFSILLLATSAQAFQINDRAQLVERDFGIPAHPGTGKGATSFRFTSGSSVTIKAIDSATGWLEVENNQGKGWIVKKYIDKTLPPLSHR